ncbi:hypothetical protein PENSPDRAFT_693460 [Peniophora sp. CONT]|nr:hypothetical protein PENSPDRAFT_693460 [Peniophora sp. CONT]
MSGRTPILGVNAILHAKPEQKQVVWDFLAGGQAVVDQEPDTLQWFAYKCDDSPDGELGSYGIVDSFPSAEGRNAHVNGLIPQALIPKVDELLAAPPALDPIDIIASKVSKNAASESKLLVAGVVYVSIKEGSSEQVKKILTGSYATAIHQEDFTHYWYAFQKDATTFGLFAAWHTEEERTAHFGGAALEQVKAAIGSHLAKPLDARLATIIAQKTHG